MPFYLFSHRDVNGIPSTYIKECPSDEIAQGAAVRVTTPEHSVSVYGLVVLPLGRTSVTFEGAPEV
jgi:hypothetical protein